MSRIISVGTAYPPHVMNQSEARAFAKRHFQHSFPHIDRLLPIFEHTAIEERRFSRPQEWFEKEPSFYERNQAYIEVACQLGEEAIRKCLSLSNTDPTEIDHIFFVSTSGLATPSIDAHLINQLKMKLNTKRTPIWGLGCAGGVAGLARGYEYVQAFPHAKVLVVALELCSLTFRSQDFSKSNLVATALFADGAAAVLLAGEEAGIEIGPRILTTQSHLWPDSFDVMGWQLQNDGLEVIFSRDIPSLVRQEVTPVVDRFLQENRLSRSDMSRWVMHPGGLKVLQAYEDAFECPREVFDHAYEVLRQFGNMSSATVLFVLEKELKESHQFGSYGLMAALGPGFSAELLLLQW
ncbi:type III polyketide synthase [Hazenella sp. IB182357]|uniref:Type III polyketide synthase n=1 Tax=Polycladospora coralii TaxID=2771432 RepID=A0A926RVW8_9BACL|nr:3-oxoacyl-[acyl-carrier-protein] synthase III C-terminal domain-containing protein [Polycladospora coralii]MBD1370846.1 type III polyketide synthase [Polycladospora coralii]MBS7529785.1 type III polyketide synthase [Polycladospora coralii]